MKELATDRNCQPATTVLNQPNEVYLITLLREKFNIIFVVLVNLEVIIKGCEV
jgi:hypothetical protein